MKLVQIDGNFEIDYEASHDREETVRVFGGSVTFEGKEGKMTLTLTEEDRENIQQLLMNKCRKLAGEV